MSDYKYGVFGQVKESIVSSSAPSRTVLVYLGTAPVNLVRGFAGQDIVNTPVKLTSGLDAQGKLGHSGDWGSFTLCEAVSLHFENPLGNIGPIYAINVLDPALHKKAEPTTQTLTFANGRAAILSDTIILDSLLLEDKVEGVDFTVDYDFNRKMAIISSLGDEVITGSVTATFEEVDPAAVTAEDIIGGVTAKGEYSGLGSLQLLYQEQNAVPNLIAAPGWSHIPAVYQAMCSAAQQINGHWEAFVLADIPLADGEGEAIDTIAAAAKWARGKGYSMERSKAYWPMGRDLAGRAVHLSTLAAVEMLRADESHNGIPMETPANKPVPIGGLYFGQGSKNRGFDQQQANQLCESGLSTAIFWGGRWVLWGDHTAAYTYGADVDPRAIFDVNLRMLYHIVNSFQQEWGTTIDKPFTRGLKDSILNKEQEKLDALVAMGALIGSPKIEFLEEENPTNSLMNGVFRWDVAATPTPPLKSAAVYVGYTDAGFAAYFEGGK